MKYKEEPPFKELLHDMLQTLWVKQTWWGRILVWSFPFTWVMTGMIAIFRLCEVVILAGLRSD
jgi:hypothetical protein